MRLSTTINDNVNIFVMCFGNRRNIFSCYQRIMIFHHFWQLIFLIVWLSLRVEIHPNPLVAEGEYIYDCYFCVLEVKHIYFILPGIRRSDVHVFAPCLVITIGIWFRFTLYPTLSFFVPLSVYFPTSEFESLVVMNSSFFNIIKCCH